MKKILFSATLFLVFAACAQKSPIIYDKNAQIRTLGNFNAIRVSSTIDLYLTQSSSNQVAVSASDEETRDQIETFVEGNTLVVRLKSNNSWFKWKNWENKKVKAYVSVKDLNALTASGATTVHLVSKISAPKLNIKLSGASDLKGDIESQNIQLNVSGASNYKGQLTANAFIFEASGASVVELAGNVNDLSMDVSGASSVKMYNLIAKGAIVDASGASSVNIHVTELLKVHATGASSIKYKGAAVIKEINNSGASTIKHRD
jgi:hypothetical protein